MINHLRVGKTATFHKLKRPLSNAAVDDVFRQIRAGQRSVSQNLFHHRREVDGDARWSAVSFLFDRPPPFLPDAPGTTERICGFLLLVEYRNHLATFKSRLDLPSAFVTRNLGRVSADRVDRAIAHQEAIFEKIGLRHMSLSKGAMRRKTFEADDLRNVVGRASASRYAPQNYAVRSDSGSYSATPSTGRIAQRSDRVDCATLIHYAKLVIDDLVDREGDPSEFIRSFARPINLADIEGLARPICFAVDVADLRDLIFEHKSIRLVRVDGDACAALVEEEANALLTELDNVFEVGDGRGRQLALQERGSGECIGSIAINKSRIALRELALPLMAEIEVENTAWPVGEDPERLPLRRYIDRDNKFVILFNQLTLAYIDGTLFRDDAFATGGRDLLHHLKVEPSLAACTSEKGNFTPGHVAFDDTSTFGVVVSAIANDDDILICDDLGDEWADFIGIHTSSSPTRVTFYHAKHGELSLGASPFHVSVGQALKNLGNMRLDTARVANKLGGWGGTYNNNTVATSIRRLIKGDYARLANDCEKASNAPDTIRRVFIVTSSLSRQAVIEALDDIAAGGRPDPYFVQLYWLLMSFFSTCMDMNSFGYVVCQE